MIIISSHHIFLGVREAISTLPIEKTINLNISKMCQELIECFYAYESHLSDFVFDRDMYNIIYSLGFVPVCHREKEKLFYFVLFVSIVSK